MCIRDRDIVDSILPGIDTSENKLFSADVYDIIADGNEVSFVVGGSWTDIMLFKSSDNGDTWNKTVIFDHPVDGFVADMPCGSDIDGDCVVDTVQSTDGAVKLIVDAQGTAHVAYGIMRVLDADPTDGSTSFFPGTNGLMYWNENMSAPAEITGALDINGNGVLDAAGVASSYGASLSSFPSFALDPSNGDIYLSYSAHVETLSFFDSGSGMTDSINYRHVYVMKSSDGGSNWSNPVDVTPDDIFAECVFADMGDELVNDSIRMVYQRDFLPGHAVGGNADHSPSGGDMVYLTIPKALNIGIEELSLIHI